MHRVKGGSTIFTQSDESIIISNAISHSDLYWNFCFKIKDELSKKKKDQLNDSTIIESIALVCNDATLGGDLKNKIYDIHKKMTKHRPQIQWVTYNMKQCANINELPPFFHSKTGESLQCIIAARKQWDEFLLSRSNAVCDELRTPIIGIKEMPIKIEKEKKELIEEKDDDVEVEEKEPEKEPPPVQIYNPTHLLNALFKN